MRKLAGLVALGLLALPACSSSEDAVREISVEPEESTSELQPGLVLMFDGGETSDAVQDFARPLQIEDEEAAERLASSFGRASENFLKTYAALQDEAEPVEVWLQYLGSGCELPRRIGASISEDGSPILTASYTKAQDRITCVRSMPALGLIGLVPAED